MSLSMEFSILTFLLLRVSFSVCVLVCVEWSGFYPEEIMVLLQQLTAMIDFLEAHPELALGQRSRSIEGRSQSNRLWAECAQILNSVSADCPSKSPAEWRLYYNEYKHKVTRKIRQQKREISATGGGPAKKIKFTPLEERLHALLGYDLGEPLQGVRHNPLHQHPDQPAMEVDIVDVGNSASISTESTFSIILDENGTEPQEIRLEQEEILDSVQLPSTPENMQSPSDVPGSLQASQASNNVPDSLQTQINRRQPLRRRRPRARTMQQTPAEERDRHAALEASQARLEAIEARNAEAISAQALATERLSDSINRLSSATTEAASMMAAAIEKLANACLHLSQNRNTDLRRSP